MAKSRGKNSTDLTNFTIFHNEFIDTQLLNGQEKLVFIAIKRHLNNEKLEAFPSIKTICKHTGLSKPTVIKSIKSLEEKNILIVERRQSEEKGFISNLYTLMDYKEIWKATSEEDMKEIAQSKQYEFAKRIIESAGGRVIDKNKNVPETTTPTKVLVESDTSLDNNSIKQDYKVNESNCQEVQKVQERYPLEQIKEYFYYEAMVHDNPYQKKDIDSVISILHTALNTTKNTIRIGGEDKPTMSVIGKLMKLTHLGIMYAIEKYKERTGRINEPIGYMLKLLYVAEEQMNLDIANRVQYDMAHQNQTEEVKEQNYEENQPVNPMEQAIEVCKNYSQEQEAEYKERYKKTALQGINQESFDKQEAINDLEKEWSKSNQETKKQQEQNKGISLPSEPQKTQNNEASKEDKAMPKSAENYNDYEQRQYSQEFMDDLEVKLCAMAVQQSD